ncbi:MAG: MATE family efflux transporter [Bacteroidetes bacterium]|jgi:MATE family multidrug resistance protein|nr:MAG: MATE family efflux transporter [Bacteroidota bacterium]
MAGSATHSLQVEVSNRQIFRIALPISLAILVPQVNFIANNIFLGHHSQHALAVASIAGVYYLIFAMIGYGLNSGLQTLIARRAGENRPEEIGKIFGQGVFISLIIASVGILLTWFVAPVILQNVIHEKEISIDAIRFLKIRIWGLPFLYIYQMRNALLVGTNNSRYLVAGTLAETITNVALDWMLILGHLGFAKMGLDGAAIASIIAEFIGMFVIFVVIHYKGISQRFSLFKHFRWSNENAKLILSISLPLVFQLAISLISWEYFYILIEHHGQTALAVSNVMRNIFGLVGCITWALASTTSAMVSNIIGQGKSDQVIGLIWKIIKISTGFSTVIAVLINLFPEMLLSIYGQDEAFTVAAMPVVRVVTSAMVLMSFSGVWVNAITGTGNSRVTFLIELITIILYCFYVWLVLEKLFLSITIGWMSEWLYWLSLFTMASLYMKSGKWKNKVI